MPTSRSGSSTCNPSNGCRDAVYKQALLAEAGCLVQAQVLAEPADIFYLRLQELHDVVRTNRVHDELIRERKNA